MAVYMTDIPAALHTRLSGQLPFTDFVTIDNAGGYTSGATSMTVLPLPVALDSGVVLTFPDAVGAGTLMITTEAAAGDTTILGSIGFSGTSVADGDTAQVSAARAPGLVLEDDDIQSRMEELANRVRVMAIVLRSPGMNRVLERTVVDYAWEVDTIENPAVNRPTTGTYYTAEAVAESVFTLLDGYQIPNSTLTGTNKTRASSITRIGREEPAGSLVRYKVTGFVRSKLIVNTN